VAASVGDQVESAAAPFEDEFVGERDLREHDPMGARGSEDTGEPGANLRPVAGSDGRAGGVEPSEIFRKLPTTSVELGPALSDHDVPDASGRNDVPSEERGVPPDVVPVPVAVDDPRRFPAGAPFGGPGEGGAGHRGQH
jgi:hypothetical protein